MIKNLSNIIAITLALLFILPIQTSSASNYGPVAAKETLWNIASRNRPSYDVTTQQMMIAIQRTNPHAFATNNINSLKAGAVLHLPSLAEIDQANQSTALHAARQQNVRWQASKKQIKQKNTHHTHSSSRSKKSKSASKSSYKRYYKASQRELRKLQKQLKREQRKVRKLKEQLALANTNNTSPTHTQSEPANISALQSKVNALEKVIEEKNVHISQLENMKVVAAETIKKQAKSNDILFNKLKAIAPEQVLNQSATSGSLTLQGIDTPPATPNNSRTTALGSQATASKASKKDNGFVIVIAVLALLFAFALLWRVYSQYVANKAVLTADTKQYDKPDENSDDSEDTVTTGRKEPLLST